MVLLIFLGSTGLTFLFWNAYQNNLQHGEVIILLLPLYLSTITMLASGIGVFAQIAGTSKD